MEYQPTKKMLLLSVYMFSLFFSFFNIYSLELYLSVDNKHYIFLICNGILVLLAKTSGIELGQPEAKEEELEGDVAVAINKLLPNEEQEQHYSISVVLEDKQASAILNEENEMEFKINALCTEEEEEEEEEKDEALNKLSTEALNRKFEEFIRRVKEEIRMEPQQQLVIVT